MEKMSKLFPTVLVVIDVLASVPYAIEGDVRHAIYWIAAATLTACVTY